MDGRMIKRLTSHAKRRLRMRIGPKLVFSLQGSYKCFKTDYWPNGTRLLFLSTAYINLRNVFHKRQQLSFKQLQTIRKWSETLPLRIGSAVNRTVQKEQRWIFKKHDYWQWPNLIYSKLTNAKIFHSGLYVTSLTGPAESEQLSTKGAHKTDWHEMLLTISY